MGAVKELREVVSLIEENTQLSDIGDGRYCLIPAKVVVRALDAMKKAADQMDDALLDKLGRPV